MRHGEALASVVLIPCSNREEEGSPDTHILNKHLKTRKPESFHEVEVPTRFLSHQISIVGLSERHMNTSLVIQCLSLLRIL